MTNTVTLTRARADLGAYVDAARYSGAETVITSHGKPVAKLVPYCEPQSDAEPSADVDHPAA